LVWRCRVEPVNGQIPNGFTMASDVLNFLGLAASFTCAIESSPTTRPLSRYCSSVSHWFGQARRF
jgi:hypothetical protein